MNWTEDMLARAIHLYEAGYSASGISIKFAEDKIYFSRNAISGCIDRLITKGRLTKRGNPSHRSTKLMRAAKPKPARTHALKTPIVLAPTLPIAKPAEAVFEPKNAVTLLDLGPLPPIAEKCRWPLGDVMDKAKLFCGDRPVDGFPYCVVHHAASYSGTTRRY